MTMPNLYLIQDGYEYRDYDTYDSAVVCANSEAEAKRIHPDGVCIFISGKYVAKNSVGYIKNGHVYDHFNGWIHPKDVQVTFVGVAAKGIQPGTVVCASYNA